MRFVVAVTEPLRRRMLEADLRAAGFECESVDTPERLRRRLESLGPLPAGQLMVVITPDSQLSEEFSRIALESGVPVAQWPPHRNPVRGQPQAEEGDWAGKPTPPRTDPLRPTRSERKGPLTAREREILELVAAGISNKGIARKLHLSPNTVKFHVAALLEKLGAASRAEAVAIAARRGELAL